MLLKKILPVCLAIVMLMVSCITVELPRSSVAAAADAAAGDGGNQNNIYSDEDYLTAAGTGDTVRDAQDDAIAALARIFSTRVKVDTNVTESYRSLISDDSEYSEKEVELIDSINITANQELINVKFSEAESDDLGRVHVIAYLDRSETGAIYQGLIRKNNTRLENFRERSRSATGKLAAYAYIQASYTIALANEGLIEQLRIINPDMLGIPLSSLADIEVEYRELQSGVDFRIEIEGDDAGQVEAFIAGVLGRFGFVTSTDALLAISGSLDLIPSSSDKYETIIWTLIMNLVDEADRSIASVEATNREQGLDQASARALAMRTIRQTIEAELAGQLFAYLTDLAKVN